ncbi:MAG: fatty acid hydroxylase [Bacteroidetes bacterium]|nr:MAG: fatty acid hydroxylase [Bacteroidota bacterium]
MPEPLTNTDMKDFKINNKGSKRLFKNPLLESLTRTYFLVPVCFYYLISVALIIYTLWFSLVSFISIIGIFILGALLFTLVEYLIHRYIFHFDAKTEKEEKLQYNIHGVHHEFPRDKDRLVMPPVLSVIIAFLFFLVFITIFASKGMVLFAGFSAGYSNYLLIHYFVHARKPPANFLKFFWTHHSLHHYHSVDTAFSVSFPFWDYLYGNMPSKDKTKHIDKKD